ncbi:3151_t:CDS:2 [Ambispora gerdemannii]|uniref:3151_t:CDS:1 n=1 Tax=Ambispora gerdemannii TaxID=144530 RepID=A0A9N9AZT9_9GLOM|nr:3151_t:CDS:2 [Ambispora gerdemannii]
MNNDKRPKKQKQAAGYAFYSYDPINENFNTNNINNEHQNAEANFLYPISTTTQLANTLYERQEPTTSITQTIMHNQITTNQSTINSNENITNHNTSLPSSLDLAFINQRLEVHESVIDFNNLENSENNTKDEYAPSVVSSQISTSTIATHSSQTSIIKQKRKRSNTSWVWKWFNRDENERIAKYKITGCNVVLSLDTSTSSYSYHLAIQTIYQAMQIDENAKICKDGNNLATLYMTDNEWDGIKELVFVLHPFAQATNFLRNATYSTISILYHTIKNLFQHIQYNTQQLIYQPIIQIRNAILNSMKNHWKDPQDLGLLTSLMDLYFKSLVFVSFSQKEHALSLIHNYINSSSKAESSSSVTNLSSPMLQFFEKFGICEIHETKSELDLYMNIPILSPTEENDPIHWWKVNHNTFPQLAKIAHCYLSIPASSVLAERLFSNAGNILTEKRNHLDPTTVSDLLFLQQNSTIFTIVSK